MQDPFEEYIRQGEPDSATRADLWQVAIGLQAVDGLKPSRYLIETAQKHIARELTIEEVQDRISAYYQSVEGRKESNGTEEADIVSSRITQLLSEKKFSFTPAMLTSIHRSLFRGVLLHAGQYRTYDITKKEWVLDNDTVLYAPADMLSETLQYDFSCEKSFSYKGLSQYEIIAHLSSFISGIWQIHPFGEGNTRTTAVFTIKYLQSLGYEVSNDPFKQNSWYFRNALVRANYSNLSKNIERTTEYLQLFFRNMLLGEHNELRNRFLHIRWKEMQSDDMVVKEDDAPFYNHKSSVEISESSVEKSRSTEKSEKSSVEIIRMISENNKITAAEMAERLGITTRAVEKQLAILNKKGLITRVGPNKGGHWEINS